LAVSYIKGSRIYCLTVYRKKDWSRDTQTHKSVKITNGRVLENLKQTPHCLWCIKFTCHFVIWLKLFCVSLNTVYSFPNSPVKIDGNTDIIKFWRYKFECFYSQNIRLGIKVLKPLLFFLIPIIINILGTVHVNPKYY